MTDATTDQEDTDSIGVAHGLGLSAAVATLFLILRLLAVADWHWYTASAMIEALDFNDVVPIVLGTLFARPDLTGALLMIMLPLIVMITVWPLPGRRRDFTNSVFAVVLLVTTVALVSSFGRWWILAAAAILFACMVVARRFFHRGLAHRATIGILKRSGTIALAGALLLAVVVDTPWMSRERLTLTEGEEFGYVLQVQPGFVKVLTDEREVVIINTGDLTSRTIVDDDSE